LFSGAAFVAHIKKDADNIIMLVASIPHMWQLVTPVQTTLDIFVLFYFFPENTPASQQTCDSRNSQDVQNN